ncbi:MAG TPA: XTP/dITP diphosphatase [Geobacteraceae bacterium]|nr:XTP/dITP diphosphatase [Geobacteraceae bacterium]
MKELLAATGNRGKLAEIRGLLRDTVEILYSPDDFPAIPPVIEDGENFTENALKKALSAVRATGKPVIADDSGLEVDALGGRPGVLSARYAGEKAGDAANNARLLQELAHVPEERRSAAFRCVIALCLADGSCRTFTGELKGVILKEPRGTGGFGYDPLFLVPEYGLTLAELSMEIKNVISHRGKAFDLLKAYLAGPESEL